MKITISSSILLALYLVFGLLFTPATALSKQAPEAGFSSLRIEVISDKQTYLPGELLSLKFNISNPTNKPISIRQSPSVFDGDIKVFIAYENGEYEKYTGPGWGLRDRARRLVSLNPKESIDSLPSSILWNYVPETEHLSEPSARQAKAGRVLTAYATPEPGNYQIKVIFYNSDKEYKEKIESEPIQVKVERPAGDDLAFWEEISKDPIYGYFIQTKDFPGLAIYNSETLQRLETLERLIVTYPMSQYSKVISPLVEEYAASIKQLGEKYSDIAPNLIQWAIKNSQPNEK